MKQILTNILTILLFTAVTFAAPGDLDLTFNGTGKSVVKFGTSAILDVARSTAIQSDGKIVVAGSSNVNSANKFAVARYNADGSLDTSFDFDGYLTTAIGASNDEAYSLAIQSDGKIVVAGSSTNGGETNFAIVRYNADGSLDTSFGVDGKVTTSIGFSDSATALAIQTDGKIVAAGFCSAPAPCASSYAFAVVRYNSNGSLDPTFGSDGNGIVTTDITGSGESSFALSVAIRPDGKIVTAGYVNTSPGTAFAVVRYNSDGSLDTGFDSDGIVTTVIQMGTNKAKSVAIQLDGKIIAAGDSNQFSAFARYNSDGSLDPSFGTDGIVVASLGGNSVINSVSIQSDGRVVGAGYVFNGTSNDFAIARLNSDGSFDDTFDTDGIVLTPIGTSNEQSYAVAINSADGTIVAAGSSYIVDDDFAVVRYNSDGSLDASFGVGGKVTTDIDTEITQGYATAVQSDGKIIAVGWTYNGIQQKFAVVRYNANGSFDNSFDSDGKVTTAFGIFGSSASAVAIQSDGKIVVAGTDYSANDFAVVRYNTNGSLDTSFGLNGKVITNVSGGDLAYAMAIQADGKIVVVGSEGVNGGSSLNFAVVRYNSNGSLDTTFDSDGKVTTPVGAFSLGAKSVAIQSNGKIVAAGSGGNDDFAVVRYNTNGSLDTSLDSDGIVVTQTGPFADRAESVVIQTDGKLVVSGWSSSFTNYDFAIVRYNSDGSLDSSFAETVPNSWGIGGIAIFDFAGSDDYALGSAIDSQGRVAVVGRVNNNRRFGVIRLQGSVPTAASVSISGRVRTANGSGLSNAIVYLADTSSGNIRTTRTGSFGYYRFDEIQAGQTVVIGVNSKRYQFEPRVLSIAEDLTDLDFLPIGGNQVK